jgi:hypothetical protein
MMQMQVVVACDGGVRHLLNKNLKEFDEVMKRGVGLACIHYGVETTKGLPEIIFLNGLAVILNLIGRSTQFGMHHLSFYPVILLLRG